MNGFIIFIIIAVISSLVKKSQETGAAKKASVAPRRLPDDGEPAGAGQPADYDERMRRIREEIRRKIDERRGAAQPVPLQPPEFQAQPATADEAEETVAEVEPLPALTAPERRHRAEAVEELANLAAARAAVQATAAARVAELSWATTTKPAEGTSALRKDLRSARDLRHAMVLREVLGPPVALR